MQLYSLYSRRVHAALSSFKGNEHGYDSNVFWITCGKVLNRELYAQMPQTVFIPTIKEKSS